MDPSQLKASYDQMQFLSDKITNLDKDLFNTQNQQNVEGLKSQHLQTQNILDTQERSQYANENRQNRNFQLLNDGIKGEGASIKDTMYRTSAITNDSVGKGSADNLLATERSTSRIDDNIYRTAMGTDEAIYRSQASVNDTVTLGRIESQKNTNELITYLKGITDNNWSNFANTVKDIYQGKAETILSSTNQYAILSKQASENTSAVQMEALKNKGDLAKQMAFEYSSLKDKIGDSESSIKEVLRAQESDRLRDVLRAAEHKSLYFELKNHHGHGHGHRRRHHH